MSTSEESLLTFPCDFPLKIMGRRDEQFAQSIADLLRELAPGFEPATMDMRPSRNGTYLSLTCVVHVTSREQLDGIYRALTAHPLVKFAL